VAKNCIGLDIGSSAIKVVQVKQTKRGVQLVNFGVEPTPAESIVDGSVLNTTAVAEAIRALFGKLRIKQKEVGIAISGHSVIIKKITVPAMTKEELDDHIYWEVDQHIPFAKDDVEIDHQILASHPSQNQMDLLLVAAKKEVVVDYTSLVREAQLNPVVVDVGAFSLQNCFELNYGTLSSTVALLNVGASISTINILQGGVTTFTRDVTIGGNAFTEEVQKQLNVGLEEAEVFKCGGTTGHEVIPMEVETILRHQAEIMASEFQRSFDFYLATTTEGQIDRIYLSGGSAKVTAMRAAIEARARIPLEVLDPFKEITVDESKFDMEFLRANASSAGVAVGLALRTEGDTL
jgi:type IV pilus assembly protein PilM